MSDAANMAERHGRVLAELSELGLAMARDLQGRALAVGTVEEATALGLAFQRTARTVRQVVALEAKLERDRQMADRKAAEAAVEAQDQAVARRRKQLKLSVERLIWREADGFVAERLCDELDDILGAISVHDDFLLEPADIQIAQLCDDLGLTLEPEGEDEDDAAGAGAGAGPEAAGRPVRPPELSAADGQGAEAPDLEFDAAPPPGAQRLAWPHRVPDPG